MKKLWLIALLLVVAALSGCTDYIPIPEDYSLPEEGAEEAYDDLMPTPGGGNYRGNVKNWEGDTRVWPPVETVVVELDSVSLHYREYIETEAGETRNNVFTLWREDGFWDRNSLLERWGIDRLTWLELYAVSIPAGIELIQVKHGSWPGTLAALLLIKIAPEVAPGRYDLEIGLEVEGRNYGTVPCVIEVVE